MTNTVTITIDGADYQVEAGTNLLQACLSLQMDMPYFCWHPAMGSVGSCRQCAMMQYQNKDDDRGRLIMSCMTPVTDGMIVSMATEKAVDFRATAIEAIMTNHPHDCPVCEEGGDCHLQDMTLMSGHINRQYPGTKRTHLNQNLGPLINHEMNRCIGCYRCVRFYRDYAGGDDLNVFASHNHIYFGRYESGTLENHFAGNLAEVCPTGVFTDKTFSQHYVRKWDLSTAPTICNHCSAGCNTYTSERGDKIRRVNNRYHPKVNQHFICDRGRFGYQYNNHADRLNGRWLRPEAATQSIIKLPRTDALEQLHHWTYNTDILGICSGRSSIENIAALTRLVGENNCFAAMNNEHLMQHQQLLTHYQNSSLAPASFDQIEQADTLLLIGEDPSHTAPRLALSIRQMTRNAGIEKAAGYGVQHWQDQAVRNIAQDTRSPLYILHTQTTALDDVASLSCQLSPQRQINLLLEIEKVLKNPDDNALVSGEARTIAQGLIKAKRPAIVTGCGNCDNTVLTLCLSITQLIRQLNSNALFYCSSTEANSLALAELVKPQHGIDYLIQRIEKQAPTTLIVLEADLYRLICKDYLELLLNKIKHIIVLDYLFTPTAKMADLVLPTTASTQSNGHWLSAEGRLQQSYAAMTKQGRQLHGYEWLAAQDQTDGQYNPLDQVRYWCAKHHPVFADINEAKPSNTPFSMARQPLRSTGRTAINANIDVKEYPPAKDQDNNLNYSMEGVPAHRQIQAQKISNDAEQTPVTGVWSPKWNSSQGINKSLDDINQASELKIFGKPLFNQAVPKPQQTTPHRIQANRDEHVTICPEHHIYADDELIQYSDALKQLIPQSFAKLNSRQAQQLGIKSGDSIYCKGPLGKIELKCQIADVAFNVILVPWVLFNQLGPNAVLNGISNHADPEKQSSTQTVNHGDNHE